MEKMDRFENSQQELRSNFVDTGVQCKLKRTVINLQLITTFYYLC